MPYADRDQRREFDRARRARARKGGETSATPAAPIDETLARAERAEEQLEHAHRQIDHLLRVVEMLVAAQPKAFDPDNPGRGWGGPPQASGWTTPESTPASRAAFSSSLSGSFSAESSQISAAALPVGVDRGGHVSVHPASTPEKQEREQEPPTPLPIVAKLEALIEIFASSPITEAHARPLSLQLLTLETTCGRPPSITLVDVARETLAELAIAGSKVRDVETYAGRIARDLLAPGRLEAKRKEREAKGVAKAGGTSTSPSVVRKPVIFG